MKPARRGVFISYRGMDAEFSPPLLHQRLSRQFGKENVFLDAETITAGDSYPQRLVEGLRSSAVLLAVIGPRWLTLTDDTGRRLIDRRNDWVRRELATAFAEKMTVIPVCIGDTTTTTVPAAGDLPPDIAQLSFNQALSLRSRYYSDDLKTIVKKIKKASPELVDRPRRRAVLISVGLVAIVAGAVAFGASLFVDHRGSSNPTQPTGPAIESGATLPTTTSSGQPAGVFWHGPVALDVETGDTNISLDTKPPAAVSVGDIGLVCDVGCDPHKIIGTFARSSGSGPPDRQQCSDLVENPENPHLLDVREGAFVCFKTIKNRLGYLKVTGVSDSRLTFDVTVWEAS